MCCGSGKVEVYQKPQQAKVVKVEVKKVEEVTTQSDTSLPAPKVQKSKPKKVSRKTRNYRKVL